MAADFPRLVSLACHDLRTPLATVQGFAKTLLRLDDVDPEKRTRYLTLIDTAADELTELLTLLSLAARIEGGRYDPVMREVDSLEVAPDGAGGTGAQVAVEPEAAARALAALRRAAALHGGVDVAVSVDGANVVLGPVTAEAAPVVMGEEPKDLGSLVAARVLGALGAELELEGERLTVRLRQA